MADLADGRVVPDECVRALDELDTRWPGATFAAARPAIVAAVLAALPAEQGIPVPTVDPLVCDVCDGAGVLPTDFTDDLSACMNCLGRGRFRRPAGTEPG